MNKKNVEYKLKDKTNEQLLIKKHLIENGVNSAMAEIYAIRGVTDIKEVNLNFALESYMNLLNIKQAVIFLSKAIEENKKMCIVADYDADGATACAVGILGLRMFGANISYVVPNRFLHGYGLTPSVVDEAIEKENPDILITVDNGIASFDGVDYANKKGLKVLVTDHHLQGDKLPNAECIVNPNQNDCTFKSKALAGCGVIYYILSALRAYMLSLGKYTKENAPNITSLLDLVAIGTVSDLVKLDNNNRLIVKLGLNMIRNLKTRPGVLALIEVAGKNPNKLTTTDIGFGIGPRINAAGRLKDMTIGINCLLSDNDEDAKKLASKLNEINQSRKLIESEMKTQALELDSLKNDKSVSIAYDSSFHEGVVGIVASRIKEIFYKPTIVFTDVMDDSSLIKGSGRSINEIHLRDALDYVHKKDPNIIVKFGGHAMAAGLTIKKDRLEDFINLFDESVKYFLGDSVVSNLKEIDLDLDTEQINFEFTDMIQYEVWGQGFLPPLFKGKFKILEQQILKEAHLKLLLEKDNLQIGAIWFFQPNIIDKNEIELAYSLSINEFRGNETLQLLIDGEIT